MKTDRWTDIFNAAELNDLTGVKRFIEIEKVPVNSTNVREETVAHVGAKNGNLEIVRYLVDIDSSLLAMKDVYGNSCLHLAVANGSLPLIVYLLTDRKMNMYEPNVLNFGCTPFHIAAQKGHMKVLNYLVAILNGDVDARNQLGEPPLFAAVEQQNLEVVKYLTEELGANVTMTDYDGNHVLFVSAKLGELATLKYLTKKRGIQFDWNSRNIFGMTIAILAAKYGNDDFLTYVIGRKHADPNIADDEGMTPLHEAAANGNYHMVRYLCRRGADVYAVDKYGKKPIDYATNVPAAVYLKNAAKRPNQLEPRLARSIPLESSYVNLKRNSFAISSPIKSLHGITSERESSSIYSYNRYLDNFLTLAALCFRYHKRVHDSPPLSLQSIVPSRIDPLALDSIDAVHNFE